MKTCIHSEIVVVTETPTNGKIFQPSKTYIKCAICGEILPIKRITRENINIPLYPKFE